MYIHVITGYTKTCVIIDENNFLFIMNFRLANALII